MGGGGSGGEGEGSGRVWGVSRVLCAICVKWK